MFMVERRRKISYEELNKSKRFCNDDVCSEIANEFNVKEDLVRRIMEIQSKFTATTIKAGGLETIIIPYLGKFKVNPAQVSKMRANGLKQ